MLKINILFKIFNINKASIIKSIDKLIMKFAKPKTRKLFKFENLLN